MLSYIAEERNIIKSDTAVKNFRVHFPNGELSDITNENIVYGSVKFSESVCAQSTFKFGYADESTIEFETVGIQNIIGMVIECSMEFTDGVTTVSVPYGSFVVESCPRDHSAMTHRKVKAYAQNVFDDFEEYKQTVPRYGTNVYTPAAVYMVGAMSETMLADMTAAEVTPYKQDTVLNPPFSLTVANNYNGKFLYLAEAGGTKDAAISFNRNSSTPDVMDADYVYSIRLIKGADYDRFISLLYQTAEANDLTITRNDINSAFFADMHDSGRSMGQVPIRYVDKGEYLQLTIYPYMGSNTIGDYINYHTFYGTFDLKLNGETETTIASGLNVISNVQVIRYSSPLTSIRLAYQTTQTAQDLNGHEYNTFIGKYSIRDVIEGWAELNASFARCERDGTLSVIHLDNSAPYALTADDVKESAWWDEYDINPIGSVTFKYKNGNKDMTAQYDFSDDPSVYDMTDNEILKNMVATAATATGTADMTDTSKFYLYDGYLYFYNGSEWIETVQFADFGSVCMALIKALFVPYANTVLFTPLEGSFIGMPFLQAGDAITLTAADGTVITTYFLSHSFSGGQEITEEVSTVQGEVVGVGVQY